MVWGLRGTWDWAMFTFDVRFVSAMIRPVRSVYAIRVNGLQLMHPVVFS